MRIWILFASVIACGAVSLLLNQEGRAAAVDSPDDSGVLSPVRAAAIAMNCATCHGTDGRLQTIIPPLAGKPESVLRAQLLGFKSDEIPGATVMPRLAKGYSDEELEAVARHFASLPEDED